MIKAKERASEIEKSASNGKGTIYDNLIAEKIIAIIKFFLDTDDENVVFLSEINNANINKKILIIGDLNVYDEGTDRKMKNNMLHA